MENNKKIRVSCFGDSITMGLCATSAEMGYPAVLGALLGERGTLLLTLASAVQP